MTITKTLNKELIDKYTTFLDNRVLYLINQYLDTNFRMMRANGSRVEFVVIDTVEEFDEQTNEIVSQHSRTIDFELVKDELEAKKIEEIWDAIPSYLEEIYSPTSWDDLEQ